nr:putative ribonuclease H-like domain-containing protein [Tanacetum cinerariifolium]
FEDLENSDKVYNVVKALYGLHQAPRAWYEILATYLLENGFQRGTIDQTLFMKKKQKDILLVQIYVDDIIFGATNTASCQSFEKLMKDKFQMSSMRELTFFLGLQVKKKKDVIFISQDKYVADILRKFRLSKGKSASTPIDTDKPLLKDSDEVNTPRSDEDRLKLMELMVFLLQKGVCDEIGITAARLSSYCCQANVFANMRRVGKGFSGVKTPLFEGMLDVVQPSEEGLVADQVQIDDAVAAAVKENVADDVAHDAIPSPPPHDIPSPSQEPSSPLQQQQRIELVKDVEVAESEGRHVAQQAEKQAEIYNLDLDHSSKVLSMQEDDSEVQEVVEVVTTAKLITEVVTAAASQVSAASITIPAASATIPAAKPTIRAAAPTVVAAYTRRRKGVIIRDPEEELPLKTPAETPKVKDKGKGILVETPKPMKKKDQIELDAEYAKKLHEEINKDYEEFNKDIDWDAAMDHVNQKSNNPQYIKRYQGMKKRPQTESEARKNMMIYLKNTAGYKMDCFKGMTYAQICPIFEARFDENIRFLFKAREEMEEEDQEIIKSINETPTQKAAKRRKLTTSLASKVPVMDYQIVLIDNKPRYLLSRFTLEQLVNVTRLQVKEESKISLELLRFTRQQLQEYQQG